MPRVQDGPDYSSRRRPHLDDTAVSRAIRCYCKVCDQYIESNLPLRLSEFCDCDQYTRWICMKCKVEEDEQDERYYSSRTKGDYEYPTGEDNTVRDDGMWLGNHQSDLAVSQLTTR
jgi:hypothetical protein